MSITVTLGVTCNSALSYTLQLGADAQQIFKISLCLSEEHPKTKLLLKRKVEAFYSSSETSNGLNYVQLVLHER